MPSSPGTLKIKDVPLFKGLSQPELDTLRVYLREKEFVRNDLIFFEGKPCERIFIVRSGRIKVFRTASSGREQILEVLDPGDTCACNPGSDCWLCSSSAQAMTDCSVWYLPRERYVQMVQTNSQLSRALNQLFAHRLNRMSSLLQEATFSDSKKRLVKFILDMHQNSVAKYTKDKTVFIPFTREEIAQRIGTTRETVARQLHMLKRAKLIDIKPKQVIVLKKDALEKLLG